ncbi:MAG: hypothetical protein JRF33_18270 [Deltaproteobacteria bacterium]|nr:hypothetical protein [Deltaproteobacteria bacterium]
MKRLGFFSTVALLSLAVAVAGCPSSAQKICIPQDIECEGGDVVICNAEGTEWTLSEACDDSCVDGTCVIDCTPDCDGKDCGDDGCGGSCGTCPGALDKCIEGACVCQLDCTGKDCGDDGCGGSCGTCGLENTYCGSEQLCLPCETAVCGVCDEIDISTIVAYSGAVGGDHAIDQLRAECFTDWPITTDLEVTFDGASAGFILHHFDGESWRNTIAENFTDGAVMVACWDSIAHGGIFCQSWEWYTPDVGGIYRHFDWPVDRPVAHVLISAIDDKRTAIKYFDSWPFNNLGTGFDGTDVSTNLPRRSCQ